MVDIAVIIVNWNAREDLRACLQSLAQEPRPQVAHELWVVDNASSDGSAAMVQSEFPGVNLITNPDNRGFSKANNQAIAASNSRYAFLLNSDAAIHPGALDALVAFADAHPKAGVMGPKVLNPDGSLQFSCRRFPSLGAGFFRNTLLGRLFPNNRYQRDYLMADFDHSATHPVDWLSGCAMLLRREMIERTGSLDEQFFMYCEDVDLCWRAWKDGWEVVYVPDAVVTHAIGASSNKNMERMTVEFHKSWYAFDRKKHPGFQPIRRLLVAAGLSARAGVRILHMRQANWQARRQTAQKSEPGAEKARA